ncbi:MAG: FHA domain-containing protein [Acidobacteriota bacterium]
MNIILAEENAAGQRQAERSISETVISFGRDPACTISFESEKNPMVSRQHAELRLIHDRWMIIDLNSSYGTFLRGQRIASPAEVTAGDLLTFGTDGPAVRVIRIDRTIGEATEIMPFPVGKSTPTPAQPIRGAAESVPAIKIPSTPKAVAAIQPDQASSRPSTASIDFADGGRPAYILSKPKTTLGRAPECDIVFEASAATVSRTHAEISFSGGIYLIADNNSFNGTLVNGQRISAAVPLYHDDEVELGVGGPRLHFNSPSHAAPAGMGMAGQRSISTTLDQVAATVVFKVDSRPLSQASMEAADAQLLMSVGFGPKGQLTIGRDPSNDICLDGLQISKKHARLARSSSGVTAEDLGSTNGVFVNGKRISRQALGTHDAVQIGTFLVRVDASGTVGVFDTRSRHRIDVANITRDVRARGGGRIKLLDSVSLSIKPNEFVGLLGPSGSGKSTLIQALNGVSPATSGNVLINHLDLYRHLDSLKQAIGYVPQEDIIHRELSVYRTLYYVARLRLSRDVTSAEIDQIINEVLDVTGLAERRDVPVSRLSGGQRKRVSIAVELITKPSVIFLDEPTSGLDPATEEKIMRLFRQIADSGRTVIMTTHAMENVRMFDKIVVLIRGKLAFYGTPNDALEYFNVSSFKDLYARLDPPREDLSRLSGTSLAPVNEKSADDWRTKYASTRQFRELVQTPLQELGKLSATKVSKKRRLGVFGAVGQWLTLSRRYLQVLLKDKINLFILFAQAPIIALLTFFAMGSDKPRDFVYFVVALVAVWFGTSVAAREIIRERPVYRRERMFNLGILPYVFSKLFILGIIVGIQCFVLFVPLKLLHVAGLMSMPGEFLGVPQFWAMLLTSAVGIALGLLISALVRTSEMATSLVPLILIPQILFSGLIGVPAGISKVASMAMPAAWSFDTMKRFSTLDTLEEEGANPRGKTKGLGLYKFIATENEKTIAKAKRDLEDLKKAAGMQYQESTDSGPTMADMPDLGEVKSIPDDLSGYVTFLHPWMNEVVNQIVLVLMFGLLVLATLVVLRLQDAG